MHVAANTDRTGEFIASGGKRKHTQSFAVRLEDDSISRARRRRLKIIIIIIASHEDEMNDKYNDK